MSKLTHVFRAIKKSRDGVYKFDFHIPIGNGNREIILRIFLNIFKCAYGFSIILVNNKDEREE